MAERTTPTSDSRAVSRTRPCASGRKSSSTRDGSRPKLAQPSFSGNRSGQAICRHSQHREAGPSALRQTAAVCPLNMVPTSVDPSAREALDDLRDHDREVLEFLSHAPDSQAAFQGLRRRLSIHPEQLSRALHRLADSEMVERTDLLYRVSRRALGFFSPISLKPAGPAATILQTSLPAHVDLRGLVGALRGTWIGPLRWYGVSDADEGLRLGSALEDDSIGIEILVRPDLLTLTATANTPCRLDT